MTTATQAAATRPAATVVLVSTAGFLASLDLFIVNIAFPEIRQTFGAADFGAMSWILNTYTLVFAAFMNPAGRLGADTATAESSCAAWWCSRWGQPRAGYPDRLWRWSPRAPFRRWALRC